MFLLVGRAHQDGRGADRKDAELSQVPQHQELNLIEGRLRARISPHSAEQRAHSWRSVTHPLHVRQS